MPANFRASTRVRRWWPLVWLLGCGAPPQSESTVVVASGADLESANPLVTIHPMARQVQRFALFVTLARYDSALVAVPYLATRWQWSPDRRMLTLHLATQLRWHDGTPTTARDVAFTLDAARDRTVGFFRRAELEDITAVEVPDDSTVQMAFASPQERFPLVLCELPIVPQHVLDSVPRGEWRAHAFAREPVGNGPYRFVRRRPRESWTFRANADFPPQLGGPPQVERLVIAVVDEPTTKFAGLASGELDVAGISPAMARLAERDPQLALVTYPVIFTNTLVFNTERPPFNDGRVRKAIAAAIDRQRLVDVAVNGFGVAARGPVPDGHPLAPAPSGLADPGALLDAAGWRRGADGTRTREGVPLRLTIQTVGSGDNAVEQLVQDDLRRVGVVADLRQLELTQFLAEARAERKSWDAILTGIPGDLSLSHVAAMFETTQRGGALDYAGYHHPTLDSLFASARRARDVPAQQAAWQAIDRWLADESPVAWLYHARGIQGIHRRLQGVRMDLRGELATLTSWHLTSPH